MSRWPLLLLVLCACALGLAACGGGDDDNASTILSETFGEGKEVKSGRLDLSVKLNAQGLAQLSGPVALRLSGPFQSSGGSSLPQFDFDAALDAGGQQIKAGAVSTGDKGFVKLQDQVYDVGDELYKQFKDGYAEQAKCADQRGEKAGSFAALGIRPARWLKGAKKAGEDEKVGGTETTHISGTVDVGLFLEDVNRILGRANPEQQADPCADDAAKPEAGAKKDAVRKLTDAERKQIADAIQDARVDVWTGKDDRTLRRMNVTLKFQVPEAQREQAGGLSGGDLRFDMTFGALNEKQTIKAPTGARPLEELTAALGGQLPSGATSGDDTGGSAAGSAAATGGSKYDQCLADAGQDVKKLQGCAELIGQ